MGCLQRVDNSFFSENYSNTKILILIPHQDDEINVAGNLIASFARMEADIYVVYSTNGDYKTDAQIRICEAIKSLHILGVSKNHIIIMGYGDSYNDYNGKHISEVTDGKVKTKSNHDETYGTMDITDYGFEKNKQHSFYNRIAFCNDLKDIIKDIYADLIVCVDYDQHPDHRWLSLAFDEVMGEILKEEDNCYYPYILKKFAYANAFSAKKDLHNINLLATQRPHTADTFNYLRDLLGIGNWDWNNRVRLPVPDGHRKNYFIRKNNLVHAMLAHKSQFMVLHAESIVNSDEVFFERRTDSISYKAKISSSSGCPEYVVDFKYIDTKHIKDKYPIFENCSWIPDKADDKREISLHWDKPQIISQIQVYGNIGSGSLLKKIQIILDDGFFQEVENTQSNINKFDVCIGLHQGINECKIRIIEADENAGISEIECYESEIGPRVIKPFIKILIDGNWSYKQLENKKTRFKLSVYKYMTKEPVMWKITEGNAFIKAGVLIFRKNENKVKVRANIHGSNIFDEVLIERNNIKCIYIQAAQLIDKIWINYFKILEVCMRWFGYVKEKGMFNTIKRAIRKIV